MIQYPAFQALISQCHTDSNACCQENIFGTWFLRRNPKWRVNDPDRKIPIVSRNAQIEEVHDYPLSGTFGCVDERDDPLPRGERRHAGEFTMACTIPQYITIVNDVMEYLRWIEESASFEIHRIKISKFVCKDRDMERTNDFIGTINVKDVDLSGDLLVPKKRAISIGFWIQALSKVLENGDVQSTSLRYEHSFTDFTPARVARATASTSNKPVPSSKPGQLRIVCLDD